MPASLLSAATPAQVLGHTKTVLVLLISWLALGETMSARKAAGMAVAVGGMIAYGICVSASSISSSSASRKTSKPGGGGAASSCSSKLDAMELGQQKGTLVKGGVGSRGAVAAADADEEAQQSLPLLSDVSRQAGGWAGESVVVVAVPQGSDQVSSGGSSRGVLTD